MALLNFGGWEHGLTATAANPAGESDSGEGTAARGSIITTTKWAGTRAFRSEDTGGSFSGYRRIVKKPDGSDFGAIPCYFTFLLHIAANGQNQCTLVEWDGNTLQYFDSDAGGGLDSLRLSAASDSSGIAISTATWYLVKIVAADGASNTTLSVYNATTGTQVGSTVTNSRHGAGNVTYLKFGLSDGCYQTDSIFDDWVVSDAAITYTPYVYRLGPDGAGNSTAWTGAYTDVDEIEQDDDTTYLTTSASATKEDVTLDSTTTAGVVGTVKAAKTLAVVRDEGGASSIETYVRIGSTDYENNENKDPGSTYYGIGKVLETSPATTSAWTTSELDGTNVGVLNNNAVAVRCTTLGLMVLTDGVAGGDPEIALIRGGKLVNGGLLLKGGLVG